LRLRAWLTKAIADAILGGPQRTALLPHKEITLFRAPIIAAAALLVCLPHSTPEARTSCLRPAEVAGGGIHSTLVIDGSPVHGIGDLRVHASNWGAIGSMPGSGLPYSSAPSAEWPAHSGVQYLYVAGLWVGALVNGTPVVSTSEYEIEFRPSADSRDTVYRAYYRIDGGARFPANPDDDRDGVADEDPLDGFDNDHDGKIDEDFAAISDQMLSRHFRDDDPVATNVYPQHTPMHLDVREESYAFDEPDDDDFVGFTYIITNTGADTLRDAYIGMMADGDVGRITRPNSFADDAAAVATVPVDLGAHGTRDVPFPYWYDADGDNGEAAGRCGFVLLDHTVDASGHSAPSNVSLHTWRRFSGSQAYEDGGDPTNDAERYEAMSSERIDAPVALGDVRTLMAVGPFPLILPGQSVTFTVALVVTPGDFSNVAHAVQAYEGKWFDADDDPATGIDGRERQEHWYLPSDDPAPVWISRFIVGLDGSDVVMSWGVVTDQALRRVEVVRTLADGTNPRTLATLPGTARKFVDKTATPGTSYGYSVTVRGENGTSYSSAPLEVAPPVLPTTFWLLSPNPFHERTTIAAHLAARANINVMIFDVGGRRVATIASGVRDAGEVRYEWNGIDDAGNRVPAGVYFCRLQVGGQRFNQKLVIVR
jgi:FlgD Ig-like domain